MARLANLVVASTETPELGALISVLTDNHYTAMVFDDPSEFVDHAVSGRPDVAVIDLASPDINGYQLAADLADRAGTSEIPVVLIGADRSPDVFDSALDVGTDDLFPAPLAHQEFMARLQPLLRLSTMHAELDRRMALARRFGVEPEDRRDLAVDERPYDILAVGSDGEAARALIGEVLEGHCTVVSTDDAFTAEDQLFDHSFDACMITLDETFDRGLTLELCANIRNNPRLFNLPVIVLAAAGTLDDPMEAYDYGATRVVRRPTTAEELRFALVTLVNRQRLRWRIRQMIDATKHSLVCDELSGTYSIGFLRAHLETLIEAARSLQKHLTLVVISIPGVDDVRARFGDVAADHLLDQLAQWITGLVRVEDLTARDGAYDFCVALPDTSIEVAQFVTHRIAGIIDHTDFALNKVYQPIAVPLQVTMAELTPADTVDSLFARARQGHR